MIENIHTWLQAYYDDELPVRHRAQFKAHLATCPDCQQELQQLKNLSRLLGQAAPVRLPAPEVFASQVNLRLARLPQQPVWQRLSLRSWQLMPLGLLASWAALQAVLVLSNLLLWSLPWLPGGALLAAGSGGFELPAAWLTSLLPGWQFLQLGQSISQALPSFGSLSWLLLLDLVVTCIIGLLYLSWLASWWMRTNQFANTSAHA